MSRRNFKRSVPQNRTDLFFVFEPLENLGSSPVKMIEGGIFTEGEYSHACRLQASLTRSARRMRTRILLRKTSSSQGTTSTKKKKRETLARSGSLFLVEVAGKRGTKQLITVFADAPEENKETAETQTCEGDRRRLYFRAVGELAAMLLCGGIFTRGEYSHACRLQASLTRSARRMRTRGLQYPKGCTLVF